MGIVIRQMLLSRKLAGTIGPARQRILRSSQFPVAGNQTPVAMRAAPALTMFQSV